MPLGGDRHAVAAEDLLSAAGPGSISDENGEPARNGAGSTALVLGILSIPVGVLFPPVGLVMGLAGVVLGIIGRRRGKHGVATNGRAATAGLITGLLGLIIPLVLLVSGVLYMTSHPQQVANYDRCIAHATTAAQRTACRHYLSATPTKAPLPKAG